jgi:hypothetical protein
MEKKFLEDKKMALDQGYTEEQATKFASEEALASKQAQKNAQTEGLPEPDIIPSEDANISGIP